MEVEEVVAVLAITSGEEQQRLEHLELHGFLPVFMGVDILSKLKEAMLGKLDVLYGNYDSRAKRSRNAILGMESVDPERHGINNLAHKGTWDTAIHLY